jgi:hypothetical protein
MLTFYGRIKMSMNFLHSFSKYKNRNSSIELLRIVLILMVITGHFNNKDMGNAFTLAAEDSINYYVLKVLETFGCCAVDCFMVISGFYLSHNKKVRLSKIIDLYSIVVAYKIIDRILNYFFFQQVLTLKAVYWCFIPANYFFIFYTIVYIFSPYVSILFDKLKNKKEQTVFISLLVLIFIVYPTIIDVMSDIGGGELYRLIFY